MADRKQLKILKQGVDVWNEWRKEEYVVDLRGIDLGHYNLYGADLFKANLIECNLSKANLARANLSQANLSGTNLRGADLSETILQKAMLYGADLRNANFSDTDLSWAILQGSDLRDANFRNAMIKKTDLSLTTLGFTTFINVNLGEALGLELATHYTRSPIDMDAIKLSQGRLPMIFLRGCGLSDWEIEFAKIYNPELTNEEIVKIQYNIYDLRATQALQISPLFISYSHADSAFVDKLENRLNAKGVRFWRDIHDMTAGKIETQIDRAIRQNPTLLLILSKNSINSDWVQHEVRKARELERELGLDTLCPVALDDSWKSAHWPQRVMEQVMEYNILDFFNWEDSESFNTKFVKLLSGLNLFYKKPES